MPKYKVTLEQHKEKVIRASSLEIAEQRANKMAIGNWIVSEINEVTTE